METTAYPLDFGLTRQLYTERKFTGNDIKSFVHKVFAMYERATAKRKEYYVGADRFEKCMAPDVYVEFPDDTLHSLEEFKAWHRMIHAKLDSDDHVIDSIRVQFLSNGQYQAEFMVFWRALFQNGTFYQRQFHQTWTLVEREGYELPVIVRYIVKPADFRELLREAFPTVYADKNNDK